MATSWSLIRTLVIEVSTGDAVALPEFLGSNVGSDFATLVSAEVATWQRAQGLDEFFSPGDSAPEIAAWLPGQGGVRVWFDRYEIGPGSAGSVELFIPLGTDGIGGNSPPGGAGDDTVREPGFRTLAGAEKRRALGDLGVTGPSRCFTVDVANSDPDWIMFSPTDKCGPTSGHTSVYHKTTAQQWEYMFYDMENDGCERVSMPKSVRADFSPYIC
jgi:hypothetical protein